jgi:hypothetical protein
MTVTTIQIQLQLAHQVEPLASSKRFKIWRWGRRTGKTRGAFIAATVGHGASPNGKGFIKGGEIIWIARDYPNSDTIWRKEVLKRFANKPGFYINKQDRRVVCEGNGGSLTIYSADNIDSIRGGDWDGVIIDEGAHQDLDTVWNEVVRPGLVDRKGWAIIMSTTKAGSYFNDLCERIIEGGMGTSWGHWYATAFDNPKLDPTEVQSMIDEYVDEVKLKQEVYAELVVPGGFAFPEWNTAVHVSKAEPPREWLWVGCMDWGYVNPGWFGLAALGPDAEVAFRWEFKFQKTEPYQVGFAVGTKLRSYPQLMYVTCDSQMFASTQSEVSVADDVQRGLKDALSKSCPGLISAPKGPNSLITGKMQVHEALRWTPSKDNPNKPESRWKAPRLTFHPDCGYAITTIPKLRRDEDNPEKVDSSGPDHALDAVRYLLATHRPAPERFRDDTVDPDKHPGFNQGKRKKRWEPNDEELSDARYARGVSS